LREVLLEDLVWIFENGSCLLEESSGLFVLLTGLFEHLAIILELPVFIRTSFVILEQFKIY